jgi:hypothetical protein
MSEAVAMGGSFIGFFLIRSCRPSTNQSEADDKIPTSKSPRAISKEPTPRRGRSPRPSGTYGNNRMAAASVATDHIYQPALLTFAHRPKSN